MLKTNFLFLYFPAQGNMTSGYRPCLVVYEDNTFYYVVPYTSQNTNNEYDGEFTLKKGKEPSLDKDTKILFNQIRKIKKTKFQIIVTT